MPRRFLRKFLPHPHRRSHRDHTGRWGKLIHNPNLWHLNRHSVARGVSLGVFWSFVPLPFGQTLLAIFCAVRLKANVGLAALFTWVNNPLTMAPAAYLAYTLGRLILRQKPMPDFRPTWQWFEANMPLVWLPLGLGSLILSVSMGGLSYLAAQEVWKGWVTRRWRKRAAVRPRTPATVEHA